MERKDTEFLYLIQYLESKTLPEDENIRRKILAEIDHYLIDYNGVLQHLWITTGRKRADTTVQAYTKIRTCFFWPGLFKDVQRWCRSCTPCAMRKDALTTHSC